MDIVSFLLGKKSSGGGGNLNEYFATEITANTTASNNMSTKLLKKMPDTIVSDNVTDLRYAYANSNFGGANAPKVFCNNNVTSVQHMYYDAIGCPSIDMSGLDTSNVTSMYAMFDVNEAYVASADILTSIICNNDTRKVTTMRQMFYNRKKLTSLDLSSFETTSLTDCRAMFDACTSLMHLDIRKFDFTTVSQAGTTVFGTSSSTGVPDNCEIIVKDQTQKDWILNKYSRLTNVKTVAEYEGD